MKFKIILLISLIAINSVLTITNDNHTSTRIPIQQKSAPLNPLKLLNIHPTGLTFDGKYLWVTDKETNKIYELNQSDGGKIIQSFSSPDSSPRGLTYDGVYLWLTAGINSSSELYKYYPAYKRVVAKPANPGINLWGLAFDGNFIWSVDYTSNNILKINPSSPSTAIASYPISFTDSNSLHGLVYANGHLWISDSVTNKIYELSLSQASVIDLAVINSPANTTEGMAFDGKTLWVADGTGYVYSLILPENLSSATTQNGSSHNTSLMQKSSSAPGFTISLLMVSIFVVVGYKRLLKRKLS